jgi:hypothetical protein
MKISKKAIDLIIRYEVSSKEHYEKVLSKPEWPGLESGITVGIGYDLGYNDEDKVEEDWSPYISQDQISAMKKYCGKTGRAAQRVLSTAQDEIDIPWDAAYNMFLNKIIPKWTNIVMEILPNTNKLSGDSLGALVSLTFNRGPSFNSPKDRCLEMRNIKEHMKNEAFGEIPGEIRNMKRLWTFRGLLLRRDDEAKLFEEGLTVVPVPKEEPKPKPIPPVPQKRNVLDTIWGWFRK